MPQEGLGWASLSACTAAAQNTPAGRTIIPFATRAGCIVVIFCLLRTDVAESTENAIRLTRPWRNSAHATQFHEMLFVKMRKLSAEKGMQIQKGAPQIFHAD